MAQRFSLVVLAAAGAAALGIGAFQLGSANAAAEHANAVWTVGAEGLAESICPDGSIMIGLQKTTSDATVSMDPAAYRDIVPVCALK